MLQRHHLIAQQTKRPTRTAFRRGTARQSDQVSLRLAHADQLPQIVSFHLRQRDPKSLFHDTLLAFWSSMKPRQENTIHQLTSDRALARSGRKALRRLKPT